ncbi:MAG: DUF1997 domain-containing protein [Cyanothece sp. SIO1E1]|nr:DUF1997 domain-containing protein [Cyanothece sp. SIO1E1]
MQSQVADHQLPEASEQILNAMSGLIDIQDSTGAELASNAAQPMQFHGHYVGSMEMYADAATVAEYLDAHQSWFSRCARPMQVKPLGANGYTLIIGRFGALGYEVDAQVNLELLPQNQGTYRIRTIPTCYQAAGYDVDFQASMELLELARENSTDLVRTQVDWQLSLVVAVNFPRFIQALPKPLIQGTGDRLLNQIVKQVSRRLTKKVQGDFHATLGIPFKKRER